MITSDELIGDFERNRRIVQSQCEGLSHADSLIQPAFEANCLNWTIGHLVVHRDKILAALGAEGVLDSTTFARYTNESDPVRADGPDIRQLPELLTALDETQQRLATAIPDADMEAPFDHERFKTVGARVRFYYFHDTYHTGQTELLRSLAGRTDKVI
ncbi:MAG: DinB family protein [Acidimicrobiia bacterium]